MWFKLIWLKLNECDRWLSYFLFSAQPFFYVPLFMCQVNHFPLTLSNGGRNLQIRRRNGENTKHDFREVRPAQIRPPHSLRQFHQILTDRLIISKLYFVCKFLWSDTCFGWSTGWQGKCEGRSGELGLVCFLSLSFRHRRCHMLNRYFDGVTQVPSYVYQVS